MSSHPPSFVGTSQYLAEQELKLKKLLFSVPEPKSLVIDESARARIVQLTIHYQNKIRQFEEMYHHAASSVPVRLQLERSIAELRFDRNRWFWRLFRINDLPPEILTTIFRYVCWSHRPSETVQSQMWLTWVCRKWRTLMFEDLNLWSGIWLRDPPPYERSMAWFERAGTAPLDLRINERDERWNSDEDDHRFTAEQMSELLDKLFVKLAQIRSLSVIVDNWPPALVVLHKLQEAGRAGKPINIVSFELQRVGRPYVWIGPGYQPDFYRNPSILFGGHIQSLSHLCLNGVNIDWQNTPPNLHTIDLRRLALDVSPCLARFQEMLRECPNLYKLALDGAGPAVESMPLGHMPVHLPNLKVLELGDFSVGYARYILAQISTPNLRDLVLKEMAGEDYTPIFELMIPKVKELRLFSMFGVEMEATPRSRSVLVKLFKSMPHLGYLGISHVNQNFLDVLLEDPRQYDENAISLTSPGMRPILCPRLRTLEYQIVPTEAIVAFGKARKVMGVPLTKILVKSPWGANLNLQEHTALREVAMLYASAFGARPPEVMQLMKQ